MILNEVTDIKLGTTTPDVIYLGTQLIWPNKSPSPIDNSKINLIRLNDDYSDTEDITYVSTIGEAENYIKTNASNNYRLIIGNDSGIKEIGYKYATYSFGPFMHVKNLKKISLGPIITIYPDTFYGSGLVDIVIPQSCRYIGSMAFYLSDVQTVLIQSKELRCGGNTFQHCKSLKSVVFPSTGPYVYDLGDMFWGCSNLQSVSYPELDTVYVSMFGYCTSLKSITIPSSVKSIGGTAFYGCTSLENISIPESVTHFGVHAFTNTPWLEAKQNNDPYVVVNSVLITMYSISGNATIPNTVKKIGCSVAVNPTGNSSNITSVIIPDSVTAIDDRAFQFMPLTSLDIPDSVTSIGAYILERCLNIQSVTIGSGIQTIDSNAFSLVGPASGSYPLTSITINKPNGSVTGAPWGADSSVTINWTG